MRLPIPILIALAGAAACSSPDPQPGPEVSFGVLQDVLAGEGPGRELVGPLPAAFLVGDAPAADFMLQRRSAQAAGADTERWITLIDVSRLSSMDRTALGDRLLEPALENGGPILFDAAGLNCAALRAGQPGVWLVRLDAASRIVAAESLRPGP